MPTLHRDRRSTSRWTFDRELVTKGSARLTPWLPSMIREFISNMKDANMSGTNEKQVIVGIDGSEQAERAALWAADEAVARHARLRLIYVIRTDLSGTLTAAEYTTAVTTAKRALKSVRGRIDERGGGVTVSTTIAHGAPAAVLVAESSDADMVCVGWSGMNRMGIALMGSTATTVAENTTCPVAIVRTPAGDPVREPQSRWVIVSIGASSHHNCTVIADAASESRNRGWPVLAVWTDSGQDKSCVAAVNLLASQWRREYPDVHIYPVATNDGLVQFLQASPELGGIIMIDGDSSDDVSSTINRIGHAVSVELTVIVAHTVTSHEARSAAGRY